MPYDEITPSGERQLMRTENFADYHEKFATLLHGENLRGILGQLAGDEMALFKEKINYKLPGGESCLTRTTPLACLTARRRLLSLLMSENATLQLMPKSRAKR